MYRFWINTGTIFLLGVLLIAFSAIQRNVISGRSEVAVAEDPSYTIDYNVVSPDACGVFSLREAQILLGPEATVVEPATSTDPKSNVSSCSYATPQASDGSRSMLTLSIMTNDDPAQAHNLFERDRPAAIEEYEEYGDEAYWDPGRGQFYVRKGEHNLTLTIESNDPSRQAPSFALQALDSVIYDL